MIFIKPEFHGNQINCLGQYHSYRSGGNPNFDNYSSMILKFKDGYGWAIKEFYNSIHPLVFDGISICYVPSCDSGKTSTGVRTLASMLASTDNRIDATSCIVRHTNIPKLAKGGNRSITVHMNSIRIDNTHLIKGKNVLLLDDVTTTNNSLNACCQLLANAGASKVQCLALGQTAS